MGQGWSAALIAFPLMERFADDRTPLLWMAAGGAMYMVGFVFYINQSWPYQHSIWHCFVLAAAFCHYWPVVRYLVDFEADADSLTGSDMTEL